jgi:hypothetical protein
MRSQSTTDSQARARERRLHGLPLSDRPAAKVLRYTVGWIYVAWLIMAAACAKGLFRKISSASVRNVLDPTVDSRELSMMALRALSATVLFALALISTPARASVTYEVTISGSLLAGVQGVLAFDLVGGGSPANSVTLSTIASDGTQAGSSSTGDVTGSGPWQFGDAVFFSELLVEYSPFGTSLVFRFSASDHGPDPASVPDAFSLFILAPDLSILVPTDDPTGSSALFQYDMGLGLTVHAPLQAGLSISFERIVDVSEPSVALLLATAMGLAALRRRSRFPHRS